MVAQEFFGPCLDVQNVVKCKERIFAMQIGAILIDALLVRRYSRDQYFNFFPAPSFTAATGVCGQRKVERIPPLRSSQECFALPGSGAPFAAAMSRIIKACKEIGPDTNVFVVHNL